MRSGRTIMTNRRDFLLGTNAGGLTSTAADLQFAMDRVAASAALGVGKMQIQSYVRLEAC
jgi:hypothetical protein